MKCLHRWEMKCLHRWQNLLNAVAALLSCSKRHVQRLRDGGKIPRPVKLGSLVRWPRAEIEQWIADGCPEVAR